MAAGLRFEGGAGDPRREGRLDAPCGHGNLPRTGGGPAQTTGGGGATAKDHGPRIKDDERHEALRREGTGKGKAARIADTPRREAGRRGGRAAKHEDRARGDPYRKAGEVGIGGRSGMSKGEPIDALRHH